MEDNIIKLDEELIEQLNNMCLGAYNVQLGTLLSEIQKSLEESNKTVFIEWNEF